MVLFGSILLYVIYFVISAFFAIPIALPITMLCARIIERFDKKMPDWLMIVLFLLAAGLVFYVVFISGSFSESGGDGISIYDKYGWL